MCCVTMDIIEHHCTTCPPVSSSIIYNMISSFHTSVNDSYNVQGGREGGATGAICPGPHFTCGPRRLIFSNRAVKNSIKAVTMHILPWAPQALSAALTMCHVTNAPQHFTLMHNIIISLYHHRDNRLPCL